MEDVVDGSDCVATGTELLEMLEAVMVTKEVVTGSVVVESRVSEAGTHSREVDDANKSTSDVEVVERLVQGLSSRSGPGPYCA